ncbi:ABC transporter ATP-binding protein [Mycolicibacterium aubagnense]|uniref:ABC transporter ATP-binding protein n=2 Tax=Mycolicibacterium aubagnense TaxID=319707 RepID=A0ABM7IMM6_9MYCO|nr:nitrate/sulfonate/bicarbonate ABC transporter ATP-binding protein [Mycolicibacterium aubagnense]BBX88030.1 ABC transporter ATP-binding protein [Mycolicibacterium aubagnense]
MDEHNTEPVLQLENVSMTFATGADNPLTVLEDINLTLHDGEILGLLGRSGSGKSTLLRIADGLMKPTRGQVTYLGQPVTRPPDGMAMVFQTFALFPWLTVQQNVEAGLDALGVDPEDANRRATKAINNIGLQGFEHAYPRELSGGMRQRVGFARATVIEPIILLMDEPFSALDVLTAETLRTDFLDLWSSRQPPTKSVLMVTHNIEEAVLMCDRILVLASNPGRISLELPLSLPQPRDRLDSAFRDAVDEIHSTLTARAVESIRARKESGAGIAQPLPTASIAQISALSQALTAPTFDGHATVATVAEALKIPIDHLLPVAEALHILEFAEFKADSLTLTAAGRVFATSTPDARKRLFAEHLLRFVPLATHVERVLNERPNHQAPRRRFTEELEDALDRRDAEATMHTLITWGRYVGILTYDHRSQIVAARGDQPDMPHQAALVPGSEGPRAQAHPSNIVPVMHDRSRHDNVETP